MAMFYGESKECRGKKGEPRNDRHAGGRRITFLADAVSLRGIRQLSRKCEAGEVSSGEVFYIPQGQPRARDFIVEPR